MPVYEYECPKCDTDIELVMTISTYSNEQVWECTKCEGTVTKEDRIMCMPNVTRASYVDGTVRPGFAEQKEMHRLKVESYNLPHEKRADHKKEIKSIANRGKR